MLGYELIFSSSFLGMAALPCFLRTELNPNQ
jgi:hypothetical protein